jgi:hypothetical protein
VERAICIRSHQHSDRLQFICFALVTDKAARTTDLDRFRRSWSRQRELLSYMKAHAKSVIHYTKHNHANGQLTSINVGSES